MKIARYLLKKLDKWYRWVLKKYSQFLYFRTAKYRCPVCGNRIQEFTELPADLFDNLKKNGYPYSIQQAETCNAQNYKCTSCGANDRARLYALFLEKYFYASKLNNIKIVDFAPQVPLSHFIKGRLSLRRGGEYRTADLFSDSVDDKVDIMSMGIYADEQFDFFICSHILEHVQDDKKALAELYRILKVGGSGILMVPIVLGLDAIDEDPSLTDESERWRRFGQHDHVRLYSKEGFISRVTNAGFILHQYGKDFFGKRTLEKNGITEQSVLYVVEKN